MEALIALLREAAQKAPIVKWAFGVVGVAVTAAIAGALFNGDWRPAAIGSFVTLLMMVLLMIISAVARLSRRDMRLPVLIVIYLSTFLAAVPPLLVTSVFFGWPRPDLMNWLPGSARQPAIAEPDELAELIRSAKAGTPAQRLHALREICKVRTPEAMQTIESAARTDPDPEIRSIAAGLLTGACN